MRIGQGAFEELYSGIFTLEMYTIPPASRCLYAAGLNAIDLVNLNPTSTLAVPIKSNLL